MTSPIHKALEGVEPAANLLMWIGSDVYPKHGYTIARTHEECPVDAYLGNWAFVKRLYTADQLASACERLVADGAESAWWAAVMGAAADLEQAANSITIDADAKRSALGAATFWRKRATELSAPSDAGVAHHEALQRIGTALGLLAGSDLHTDCVPAIERLRAAAGVAQGLYEALQSIMTWADNPNDPSNENMVRARAALSAYERSAKGVALTATDAAYYVSQLICKDGGRNILSYLSDVEVVALRTAEVALRAQAPADGAIAGGAGEKVCTWLRQIRDNEFKASCKDAYTFRMGRQTHCHLCGEKIEEVAP